MPQVPGGGSGGDNSESSDTSIKIDESLEYSPLPTEPVSIEPQLIIDTPPATIIIADNTQISPDSDEYNNDELIDVQPENDSTEMDSLEEANLRQKHVSTAERRKVFYFFI